jgi:hypothetical protein
MNDRGLVVLIFLGVCVVLFVAISMAFEWSDCTDKGGVYVETVFSYECAKVERIP